MNERFERVSRLLDAIGCDFDFDYRDEGWRRTVAHWAAWSDELEIVQRLIACGSDMNARDKRMHTPLVSAAWAGRTATVRALLEREEAPLPEDMSIAIRWATFDNGYAAIPLLLAAGAPVGLPEAIVLGDIARVRRCLEHQEPVTWKDPANGDSLLHLAYFSNQGTIAQLLLQHGAPVSALDVVPRTREFKAWLRIPQPFYDRRPVADLATLTGDLVLLAARLIDNGRRSEEAISRDTGIAQDTIHEWWERYRFATTPPADEELDRYRNLSDAPNFYCIIQRNDLTA